MAEQRTSGKDRLPIKLILPRQGVEHKVMGGGAPPVPFREVSPTYRRSLSKQVDAIRGALDSQIHETGAAPVRVKLLTKAAAKSHRPEHLFSEETCPIVGAGSLGELFVSATLPGLDRLRKQIERNDSDRMIKELSCIESIEAVTPSYRRLGRDAAEVLQRSPRSASGFMTRVRLFNFGAGQQQQRFVGNFEKACAAKGIGLKSGGYALNSFTFGAECRNAKDVEALSNIVGVRSIAGMPLVRTVRSQGAHLQPFPKLIDRSQVVGDVPVVVVVDTGITRKIAELESWVVGRSSDVARDYRNPDHGTFVAGLICFGAELNPTLAGIDQSPCAVFDLQLIPNDDPGHGDTDALHEQELLISLEAALQKHANEFRVWNLSLGTDAVCSLDDFSPFAEELDNLQEKYQVSFVISAGNYDRPPLLEYPRSADQLPGGRITTPADSVLGIAVGSISHVDYKKRGPKAHEPSSFSRHGAGPNYIIKPDLIHYGGASSLDGTHTTGVRSLNARGSVENFGTSFAAPLVSRTLAQIYHQITPTPTPVLARALLIHHARDPRNGERVPDADVDCFGFGLPAAVPYCLECTPHTATMVFEDVLRPGFFLDWDNFPYPASLKRNGRYFGQIAMTIAFEPARGARWGSEYCETHIDAHFGVYRSVTSRTTQKTQLKYAGLVPPEHKNPGLLYEHYQIEKLRKWAPVRTYFGDLGKNGERGERWRLKVQLLTRHGVEEAEAFKPQPFSLIVTISDPKQRAPVYDEMARSVLSRFEAKNLAVRAGARIRGRS